MTPRPEGRADAAGRAGTPLAERLRELAPGSEQALRAEQMAAGKGTKGPRPPSPQRTQTHDARLVLSVVGDPASAATQARAHAQSRPDDDRLATLAETLTALAGPGRAPLRWMVRFPQHTLVVRAALCIVVLLAVPALQWNDWTRLSVVVIAVPAALLQTVLRRARQRADPRPAAADAEPVGAPALAPAFPVLPPVPVLTRRETTMSLLVLTAVLAALVGSGVWSYQRYAAYPRYTVTAPDHIRGYERLDGTALQQLAESVMSETMPSSGATPFAYMYGGKEEQLPVAVIAVFGAVGDFHEMTPDELGSIQDTIQSGISLRGRTPDRTWSAEPGRLGGAMRCLSYREISNQLLNACTWGDKGSVGTVVTPDAGQGQKAAAALTRAVREALLHQGTPAGSV
jgi:hypothetical protein